MSATPSAAVCWPTGGNYRGWARRPDVIARPGHRPRSRGPFETHFGSWLGALQAAGVIRPDDTSHQATTIARRIARGYRWSDETLEQDLRDVAERVGGSPRVKRFLEERERIQREPAGRASPRYLAHFTVYHRRYGTWDAALAAAGLEPLGGRHANPAPRRRVERTARRTSTEHMTGSLRACRAALGTIPRVGDYTRWRDALMAEALAKGVYASPPPSYDTLRKWFGTWDKALSAAFS